MMREGGTARKDGGAVSCLYRPAACILGTSSFVDARAGGPPLGTCVKARSLQPGPQASLSKAGTQGGIPGAAPLGHHLQKNRPGRPCGAWLPRKKTL
mgnify:CR=1 FL=1|jgi:hypothetical protein